MQRTRTSVYRTNPKLLQNNNPNPVTPTRCNYALRNLSNPLGTDSTETWMNIAQKIHGNNISLMKECCWDTTKKVLWRSRESEYAWVIEDKGLNIKDMSKKMCMKWDGTSCKEKETSFLYLKNCLHNDEIEILIYLTTIADLCRSSGQLIKDQFEDVVLDMARQWKLVDLGQFIRKCGGTNKFNNFWWWTLRVQQRGSY